MDCEQAVNLISARLDGELASSDPESLALDAHLAGCAACRAAAEATALQDAALARAFAARRRAADALADRVAGLCLDRAASPAVSDDRDSTRREHDRADEAAPARRSDVIYVGTRPPLRAWLPVAGTAAAAGFVLALLLLRFGPWRLTPTHPLSGIGPPHQPAAPAPPVARISLTTGGVFVCPSGRQDWEPAPAGSAVAADTLIRTAPPARCELSLPDGGQIRLNGQTEARLAVGRSIELKQGQVWSAVPPDSPPLRLTVADAGGRKGRDGRDEATCIAVTPAGAQADLACTPGGAVLTVVRGAARVSATGAGASNPSGETEVLAGESVRVANGVPVQRTPTPDPLWATWWMNDLLVLKGRDDPELMARVAALLSQIRGEAATRPAGAPPGPREQAVRAHGDAWSTPFACYVLSPASRADRDQRLAAARLVADLVPPAAIPDLIALLGDPDGEVRYHAARALYRLTGQHPDLSPEQCVAAPDDAVARNQQAWRSWWERNKTRYED